TLQVRVWDHALLALDCGENIAAWFSQALGMRCRLARFHPRVQRLINNEWASGRDIQTHFADGYPMLLISEASLADLNQKLHAQARVALPMNRFRPNLVIAGVEAFEEDYAAIIQIGPVQLQPIKPCPRCPIPAIDQATGISGPDPLDILQSYRANPKVDGGITFGMNVILLEGENHVLEVGQEVEVELMF
ncbi:MAG TPA: MOSC domain-containing protein, partial [Burkholderiaceae bacterium]|nr:MOSC domain-containing protein [Burkholderiaceae bacterium]